MKNKQKVNIRKAQENDIDFLSQLAADSFANAHKSTLPEKQLLQYSNQAFSQSTIKEIISNNTALYLVAESKESIVGYAHLEPLVSSPFIPTSKTSIELIRLYTKVGHEGQGIGWQLLTEAVAHSKQAGYDYMSLQVWEGNGRAQHFYQSFGFETLGTQPYVVENLSRPVIIMGQEINDLSNR
ncbi:GNAT family N-acetyltransferase [Candidatus Omnitrophota bacterium]